MEIADYTAVVTGASGHIGRAVAMTLAARGMNCLCHYYRNLSAVESVVRQITAAGRRAVAVQGDLACQEDIARLFDAARDIGKVRVLINSAAIFERRPLKAFSCETVGRTLAVNLAAPMLTSRYFVQLLISEGLDFSAAASPFAKIVNLADIAALRPWAEYGAYCAAKAGLIGLTGALAKELAPAVTVNAVAPGIVTWPEPMTPQQTQSQQSRIPAGRFARAEEIAQSIAFLLDNDYITGHTLVVDGGRSI
jgi:NAD(P)-dependent dehydrogenase (short-subunit alcohol dehydrogenase family)